MPSSHYQRGIIQTHCKGSSLVAEPGPILLPTNKISLLLLHNHYFALEKIISTGIQTCCFYCHLKSKIEKKNHSLASYCPISLLPLVRLSLNTLPIYFSVKSNIGWSWSCQKSWWLLNHAFYKPIQNLMCSSAIISALPQNAMGNEEISKRYKYSFWQPMIWTVMLCDIDT